MRIIACIEDPVVIKAILAHLADKTHPVHAPRRPLKLRTRLRNWYQILLSRLAERAENPALRGFHLGWNQL
jgi:hypothetical protein